MKIRCLNNTGEALRSYEYEPLDKDMSRRFGGTRYSEYNGLDIGKEYWVMGMIIFKTFQAYLFDDGAYISASHVSYLKLLITK